MKRFALFFLLAFSFSVAQEIKFWGEAKPGSIIIASGENITGASLNKQKLLVDKKGYFVFGFDRNAKGKYVLRVKQKKQKEKVFTYFIEQREYEKQELTLARKFVNPPKKALKQIRRETIAMNKARAKMQNVKIAYYSSGFIFPVDSVEITGDFGVKRILNGKPKNEHNGIDFAGQKGDSVYAIADGIVRIAAEDFYYNGTFVLLDHGQGLSSVYLHFSKLHVKNGDKVKKGELIGEIGSTGRATGPHLHLGVQWYKKRIDPEIVLALKLE